MPLTESRIRVLRAVSAENTIRAIGEEWFGRHARRWTPGTIKRARRMLDRVLYPWLAATCLLRTSARRCCCPLCGGSRVEARWRLRTARDPNGQIFRYAIATGRATVDPSRSLIGALPPHVKQGKAFRRDALDDPDPTGAIHYGVTTMPNERTLPPPSQDRLIRRAEVERLTGLSRSNIYNRNLHDPHWPKPVQIGPNTVAWVESEVVAWVHQRIVCSRGLATAKVAT